MVDLRRGFQLGEVFVEPARLRISAHGQTAPIEPKVMDVLSALAEHGDQVVAREQLHALVWPDAHVGYHSLARAISEARRALAAVAGDDVFIETVAKRGFRLTKVPGFVERHAIEAAAVARTASRGPSELAQRALHAGCGLLVLGLIMHGLGRHGSATHLMLGAIVIALAAWWPIGRGEPGPA
jgi:DNA-binding winged helix-turn-helix (wHTH) protein